MIALFLLWAAAQAPAAAPAAPVQADATQATQAAQAPAPAVAAWEGTLAEGLDELARRIAAGQHEETLRVADALLAPDRYARARAEWLAAGSWRAQAAQLADPLAERLGLRRRGAELAAQLQLARGYALQKLERAVEARGAYEAARADGAKATRLEAVDALADLELGAAETLHRRLGQGGGAAQQTPANTPAATRAQGTQADPIAEARAAWLVARGRLVERLRLDASDADARADAQLVQRRLEELKKLEDERKQQQQQQKQDQQEKDKQQQDRQQEDQQDRQQQDPQQGEQPEQPKDAQQGEQKDQQDAQQKKEQQGEARPLTREEAEQLLDKLDELEKKGEQLRQSLIKARREKVDKDW